jgi:hypothetical protein
MGDFFKSAFSALPTVATHPLAFVAYIVVVLAWVIIAWRVRRNNNLLKHLDKLPEADRLTALQNEIGHVPVKGGLSPAQYLRSRIHFFYFLGFAILCLTVLTIFVISAVTGHKKEEPTNSTNSTVINQDLSKKQTITINRTVVLNNISNEQKNASAGEINTNSEPQRMIFTCRAWLVPVFNPYPVTYSDENTPVCHDFPIIDVAKDEKHPRFARSEDEYFSVRNFNEGDQIVALLYMNNGGIDEKNFTARNVKISTSITSNGNQHKIAATFTGDNVEPASGSVTVQTNPNEYLEVIPKSGFMYDYEGNLILDQQGLNLGNSTFKLGDLDPGFAYALFFTFKLKVIKKL